MIRTLSYFLASVSEVVCPAEGTTWLTRLAKTLIRHCESKNKYWVITGRPNEGTMKEVPYLVRYFVFRSKWLSVYIHRFLRSDTDGLHNHPWNFATLLLEGGYKEHTFFGVNERSARKNRFVTRKTSDFHRVEIDGFYTFEERDKAPLTVLVHGPYKGDWGFLNPHTSKWEPWWTYLNLPKAAQPWE